MTITRMEYMALAYVLLTPERATSAGRRFNFPMWIWATVGLYRMRGLEVPTGLKL